MSTAAELAAYVENFGRRVVQDAITEARGTVEAEGRDP